MNNTRRSLLTAAALATASLAGTAGASAAVQAAPRITGHEQLHASIQAAAAAEIATSGVAVKSLDGTITGRLPANPAA